MREAGRDRLHGVNHYAREPPRSAETAVDEGNFWSIFAWNRSGPIRIR